MRGVVREPDERRERLHDAVRNPERWGPVGGRLLLRAEHRLDEQDRDLDGVR
jgi:hypothetical protein